MKILVVVVLVALMVTFLFVTTAEAQDLATLLNQAQQIGDEMVSDILQGIQTTDLTQARADAQAAANAGDRWQAVLGEALTLAPNDATRSSISGILTHVQAATNSAKLAVTGPDAEVKSRLDAARGEAQEAITELKPLVPTLAPTPPTLPSAGGIDASLAILAGASLFVFGLGLRRLRSAA